MNVEEKLKNFLATCARATDLELCDAIAGGVESKYGNPVTPLHDAPVHERVPFLIWLGQGFAESEGLAAQLENPFDRPGWADAYDLIGLPHIAEGLRTIIKCLPDPYADCRDLRERLGELNAVLLATEKDMFRDSDSMKAALALYLRRQIESYVEYPIQIWEGQLRATNIGYLLSAHIWIEQFAQQNNGKIPTLAELKAFTGHPGLKQTLTDDYVMLLQGRWKEHQENAFLILLLRPIFGKRYCITMGKKIMPHAAGE